MNSPRMKLALAEAKTYNKSRELREAREKITLEKFATCQYCPEESEHVIPSKDGEDRRITCDSDACIDSANNEMDGRRE